MHNRAAIAAIAPRSRSSRRDRGAIANKFLQGGHYNIPLSQKILSTILKASSNLSFWDVLVYLYRLVLPI